MMDQLRRRLGAVVVTAAIGLMPTGYAGPAHAQGFPPAGPNMSRTPNGPVLAVVSLNSQRVTVYSARGKILEAPVSTGKPGYETPAGIYSILQKRRHHYSNLYNDAAMPFMQRLTWSGIALHAGDLPGYPASHGCIRMPYDFAGRLFEHTKRGMRVVVVRNDVSPVDFAHESLFKPAPVEIAPPAPPADPQTSGAVHLSSAQGGAHLENAALVAPMSRRALAVAKEAAAEAATRKADEVRRMAGRVEREAATFEDTLYTAESAKRRAIARIEEADHLVKVSPAFAQDMQDIKAKAQERLAAAQAQIDAVYAEGKDKIDAARAARAEWKAAEAAKVAAQKEAIAAVGRPVSVFVSRKTNRLYVRQDHQALFDGDVIILNPSAALGTTIFTAVGWTDDDADLRWTALSMYVPRGRQRGEPGQTSSDAARAALDRIIIPQDVVDRISTLVTPGSSVIISDEGLSKETGEATDFIVLMGGEPQGGTARRRPDFSAPRDDDLGPLPSGGLFSFFPWQ